MHHHPLFLLLNLAQRLQCRSERWFSSSSGCPHPRRIPAQSNSTRRPFLPDTHARQTVGSAVRIAGPKSPSIHDCCRLFGQPSLHVLRCAPQLPDYSASILPQIADVKQATVTTANGSSYTGWALVVGFETSPIPLLRFASSPLCLFSTLLLHLSVCSSVPRSLPLSLLSKFSHSSHPQISPHHLTLR